MFAGLRFLEELIRFRISKNSSENINLPDIEIDSLNKWCYPVTDYVCKNNLDTHDATLLLIALASHIHPDLFDTAIQSQLSGSGDFPKLGGVRGKNFRGFLPTGETALFLLAGDNITKRIQVQQLFGSDHFFSKNKILWLEDVPAGEPVMSGKIILSPEYV